MNVRLPSEPAPSREKPLVSRGRVIQIPIILPARYQNLDEARRLHGDRVDRLAPFLQRVDPLADEVVEAFASMPSGQGWAMLNTALTGGIDSVAGAPAPLRALFDHVDRVPVWVDWPSLDRGGELLFRAGVFGGMILGAYSLVLGYCSPAGNKPLVFSGRLREQAARRLNETSRFVHATCLPGGLRRGGDGFQITVKVRLMHAQVRRMISCSGRWRPELWGEPINQHDMAATTMLFSLVVLDGMRKLGFEITPEESDRYMQLWRYSGYLIGSDPELLPASEPEALRLAHLIRATQGPPDEDSRELVRALIDSAMEVAQTPKERQSAARQAALARGLARAFVGDELADRLELPVTSWRFAVPAARGIVSRMEAVRSRLPAGDRFAVRAGKRYWEWVVAKGLAGANAEFGLPTRLGRRLDRSAA